MADIDSTMKYCHACNSQVQVSNFHRNKRNTDGRASQCRECTKSINASYYQRNKDKCNARGRNDYALKSEAYKARAARWSAAHPDKVALYRIAWRARNPEKISEISRLDWQQHNAARCARKSAYRKENPAKALAHVRARQTRLLQAMPPWADLDAILKVYEAAKTMERLTGEKWHVDHFYPLRGKLVCGLHVAGNLRVIQATINQSKSNKHPEE